MKNGKVQIKTIIRSRVWGRRIDLNILRRIVKVVMAIWIEILLGIEVTLIPFLLSYNALPEFKTWSNQYLYMNPLVNFVLTLIMVVFGVGLLLIGYLDYRHERKEKAYRTIGKTMLVIIELILAITVILVLSGYAIAFLASNIKSMSATVSLLIFGALFSSMLAAYTYFREKMSSKRRRHKK